MQKYGQKVSYASGKELIFPDFTIKFVGKREAKISNDWLFPQKMTFYDFEAAKGETRQTISWSSGTGDIGPTFFEIDGGSYVLELSQSDILKSLEEGFLVIWIKDDYEDSVRKVKNLKRKI
ncbi:MAG TPA: hypothetical protein VK400_04560 [Pyrinomonadaceae bacterium]|nr:hypothetical protein [Pyrinomonadaceae bacterium]